MANYYQTTTKVRPLFFNLFCVYIHVSYCIQTDGNTIGTSKTWPWMNTHSDQTSDGTSVMVSHGTTLSWTVVHHRWSLCRGSRLHLSCLLWNLSMETCHLWQWGRLLKSRFQQFPVGLVHSQQKLSESRYLFIDLFRGWRLHLSCLLSSLSQGISWICVSKNLLIRIKPVKVIFFQQVLFKGFFQNYDRSFSSKRPTWFFSKSICWSVRNKSAMRELRGGIHERLWEWETLAKSVGEIDERLWEWETLAKIRNKDCGRW